MSRKNTDLFRKRNLERISSPGSVDQLMRVVSRRDWIAVAAVTLVLAAALAWSLMARIPSTVGARGVLLRPHNLAFAQALAGGRLVEIFPRPGDLVRKGGRIGRLDQSELRQRIAEDRAMLASLESQDRVKSGGEDQQLALQKQQDALERAGLEAQRRSLERSVAGAVDLHTLLERRVTSQRELLKQGLIADASHDLVDAEQAVQDNQIKILDLRSRLEQFDWQLKQFETRVSALGRANLEASSQRVNQIRDLRARIAAGELQVANSGQVISDSEGRVVEIFAAPGQVVPAGGRILSLDTADARAPLAALLYFAIGDGKKIAPGMEVQLVPDTVQRERFGGIRGTVSAVSPLPVSREGALGVIGNADVVDSILGRGAYIEVTVALQTDASTFSGFHWTSSRGPSLLISPGLTAQGRVTVERRRPISYVFPFLRESSGFY